MKSLDQVVLTRQDYWRFSQKYVLYPLVFLITLGGALVLTFWMSQVWLEDAHQTLKRQEKTLAEVQKAVQFLQEQQRLFAIYGPAYRQLLNNDLIHSQDRVQWSDALLSIQKRLSLSPFVIRFEARQQLKKKDAGALPWQKELFEMTHIELEAGLHTEHDLQRVLAHVSQTLTPLFWVKACDFSQRASRPMPLDQPVRFNPNHAPIMAQCELVLFEVQVPDIAATGAAKEAS